MTAWHERNITEPNFPVRLLLSQFGTFPAHWHDELEILYMLKGHMSVSAGNRHYQLTQGDVLVIGSGEIHNFFQQYPQENSLFILQLGLSLFETYAAELYDRTFTQPHITREHPLHRPVSRIMRDCLKERNTQKPGYRLAVRGHLYTLMAHLIRDMSLSERTPMQTGKALQRVERVKQVLEYVVDNPHRNVSLSEAAELAGYSAYHFARLFKEETGMTFGQYLRSYHIQQAEQMLLEDNAPITDIAYRSGFDSVKTFNRVFKQYVGCSPTAFVHGAQGQS